MAQSTSPSHFPLSIRHGLILGIISVVFSLVLFLIGQDPSDPATSSMSKGFAMLLSIGISSWIIYTAIQSYKKDLNDGAISYGQCVGIGTIVGLVSGLISSVYFFFFVNFIDTSIMDRIKNGMMQEWEKAGMSEAQIEQALEYSKMFMSPTFMLISQIIAGLVFGLLIGLVAGIFMKNDKLRFKDDILDV